MSIVSSMETGISALRSFTAGIQVIGDNIANVGTAGYKRSRADYSDNFSTLLKSPQGTASGAPRASSQLGGGVTVSGVSTNFAPNQAEYTGIESDLASNGQGFFRVVDTSDGNRDYFTRAGNFRRDDSGYLVTAQGYRLQGEGTLGADGFLIPDTAVNPNSGAAEAVSDWAFEPSTGTLKLLFSDGAMLEGGTVQLSSFTEPEALLRQGGNLFLQTDAAGTRNDFTPGTTAPATVHSQYLELSNVDLTEEFADMITTQRGFQAGARIITTSDQLLQEAIQLKH